LDDFYKNERVSIQQRERHLNEAVDRTVVHELEHYVEIANGAEFEHPSIVLAHNAMDVVEESLGDNPQVAQVIKSVRQILHREDYIDDYLNQPHEQRAREASDAHVGRKPLMWLSVKNPEV